MWHQPITISPCKFCLNGTKRKYMVTWQYSLIRTINQCRQALLNYLFKDRILSEKWAGDTQSGFIQFAIIYYPISNVQSWNIIQSSECPALVMGRTSNVLSDLGRYLTRLCHLSLAVFLIQLKFTLFACAYILNQDEDEVDQGTMVRAGTSDLGTIRAAGSLGSSAGTMIDSGTMVSQMGTMVINSDDEDEDAGTMKSKWDLHSGCLHT